MKKFLITIWVLSLLGFGAFYTSNCLNLDVSKEVGQEIDRFNGVAVFYNGGVSNVEGRNISTDGYNLGLKYQCVEFVKRYYFEYLDHRMPNSYGHAKDFFDPRLRDGQINKDRNLAQYSNGSDLKPKVNDLLIFKETLLNPYGHVAIISKVTDEEVEIIQQNPGRCSNSRERLDLRRSNGRWRIENQRILGWLRKE